MFQNFTRHRLWKSRKFVILQKTGAVRIAFYIVSSLFFLAWMIFSVVKGDVWIAVLTAVMVLISGRVVSRLWPSCCGGFIIRRWNQRKIRHYTTVADKVPPARKKNRRTEAVPHGRLAVPAVQVMSMHDRNETLGL